MRLAETVSNFLIGLSVIALQDEKKFAIQVNNKQTKLLAKRPWIEKGI